MRVNEKMRKALSILLCLCMLVQNCPVVAFAAGEDNLCEHHPEHTPECHYAEAVAGVECAHECGEECAEGCVHTAHDDLCGYIEAVEGHDCHYECAECANSESSVEDGSSVPGTTAGDGGTGNPSPTDAPVCTCGTDDPAIHAVTCGMYVAPENPLCTCAEACGVETQNFWCDVCGFDYTACTGTDTAAAYAEGDKVSVTINGETTYYTSINDAVAKANESGNATITLLQDTTTKERLDITNSATLDLNGNTLSCATYFADDYETMVAVTTSGAKLTIIDSVGGGKLDGTGTDYALMLGEPGAYTARSASAYIDGSTVSGSVKTVSGTSMTVSGSTVESNSVVATIDMTNETTLNVFNSQILNTHSSSAASAIDNTGTLTITDSTVSGSIGVDNRGTANISGNTNITGTVCSVKSWVESQDSTLTITGGSYTGGIDISGGTATISGGSYTGGIVVSGGTATISDGTITESRSNKENAVEVSGSAELTISGGTFSATAGGTWDTGVYVHNGGTVKITGGTITSTAYGVYNERGSATITGGSISGGTVDLYVGGSDSILNLTLDEGKTVGATFPGGITAEGITLAELLATDTAAYWGVVDGKDTMLTVADDAATGITDKGNITIRAICDHKDVKLDYITTETTHTPVCSVCNWTIGEATEHTGGTATCQDPAVCEACGESYGELAPNNHASKEFTYAANEDGTTHKKMHKCCNAVAAEAENHTPAEDATYTDNGDGTHSFTCVCGSTVTEAHTYVDGTCACGINLFAVSGSTLTIDGTLGGKTTAEESDITALVDAIEGYVNSGITTIIVTGSEPALIEMDSWTNTAIGEAIYRLSGSDDYDENNPYNGKIDLILQDVTEIVDQEFYSAWALNSITLPQVIKMGDEAFHRTWFLKTITFESVLTEVNETGGVMFAQVGKEVGGCDLILNCGQMDESSVPTPDLTNNIWKFKFENEFKSITLTHSTTAEDDKAATCISKAYCSVCKSEYGEVDADAHSYGDWVSNGDNTHTRTCANDSTHTENDDCSGGTATCKEQAVCDICKTAYGALGGHTAEPTYAPNDKDSTKHDATYSCCGATVTEDHTLDVTTGVCTKCGADASIATVTDGSTTLYASDAATLNQAVTAILETGSRTFTVELPADAEAGMITTIRRAICDTEGVADGSIHLTLKGVTTIPGTTNWDGVAFGPGDIYDEAGKIVDQELVTQLASINLPDVTEIGAQAFYFCENLVTVSAPKAQTIGAQALGYTALTSVEFPELTTIPTDMFSGTWTLSSAKFPKVTTIEQGGLLVGAKFWPENNPTPFPLELTAEGDITFNGSYHFNIAERNYTGKVDLVLNIDKKDQVTFHDDGTATWQVRDDLSYTFKSITFVGD